MSFLLETRNLTKRFGGLTAVANVSFGVKEGEIFGVIGPNGAGKSTLFNVIAGYYKPTAGTITFDGHDITGHTSNEIAHRGVARTFQAVHVFKAHSASENLRRAGMIARAHSPFSYLSRHTRSRTPDPAVVARFVGLEKHVDLTAGSLAYGLQKVLGIGMAMMVTPKLILMDEPAAGLNPSEKRDAALLIRRLRDEHGITIVIVEHDMPLVMGICDRILVVNQGKQLALGTPSAVRENTAVIDAYLGEDYEFA
jgi:branched-chain amino acid transport system ATP-binding protein